MHFARLVLLNTLKKELRYELSITKPPPYLSEFIRKHNLLEKTSETSKSVYLYKQVPPYNIQIEFPFRNPNPNIKPRVYEDEDPEDEKEVKDEDDHVKSMFKEDVSKFFLTVESSPNNFIHFECFTYESSIWLQNIVCSNVLPNPVSNLFATLDEQVNYNVLNEKLQQGIVDWLKELEIVEEYAKYIELRALYKEKELYRVWLEKVIKVLSDDS